MVTVVLFIVVTTPPQDRCKTLFKQVYDEKRLKGRANDAIAAACLFIACRQEDVPRSFKEICAVSKHPKKEIGRCFKLIQQHIKTPVTPASTTDFMVRELRGTCALTEGHMCTNRGAHVH